MGKIAGRASFGLESGKQLGAREAGAFFGELKSFDRDCSPDDRVNGAIHHTHGASAEFAGNFVTTRFGECWNHELKRSRENSPAAARLSPLVRPNRYGAIRITALQGDTPTPAYKLPGKFSGGQSDYGTTVSDSPSAPAIRQERAFAPASARWFRGSRDPSRLAAWALPGRR